MPKKERTDLELVRRCVEESPHTSPSFEILLRRHEAALFRFCIHYLGHEQDAEDAVQEAFTRAFFNLHRFEERASFRTWLLRIAQNTCARLYARRGRQRALGTGGARSYRGLGREPAETPEFARTPSQGEALASLALERLPEADRQVLLLRYVSELSLREVAAVLEISLSAAKMRLYRAEGRFREEFGRAREYSLWSTAILLVFFSSRDVTLSPCHRI
jgi:RNA polymerase sigma-70 factor (ECF subfamily)